MEKLRLPKAKKFVLRIHAAVLLLIIVLSVAAGLFATKFVPTGNACIPEKEFKYFLDRSNTIQAEYQKCVKELWTLSFACKVDAPAPSVVRANESAYVNASMQ